MEQAVKLDDFAAFLDLCRRAQAGPLSPANARDLEQWVARHGEGILATIAELERSIGDILSVQKTANDASEDLRKSIQSLRSAAEGLSGITRSHGERLSRLERSVWAGPPPVDSASQPRA